MAGRRYIIFTLAVVTAILINIIPAAVRGAGFAILQQGTGAMGQGNAFVAQADDPSAVFFNPAGITGLKGTHVYAGGTFIVPRIRYNGTDGVSEFTTNKVFFPPFLYMTRQLSEQVYAGLGIFSPFGLSTVWKDNWHGRYLSTFSSLSTININPNVAFKKGSLSVSAGLNVLSANLQLDKRLALYYINPTLPDGSQGLTGDTTGYGYNIGLLYRPDTMWSFGLSYRSRIHLDFDSAKAKFDVPAAVAAFFHDTGAQGKMELPASFTAGVACRPVEKWIAEFDITWTGWSVYKEVKILFDQPEGPGRSDTFIQQKQWRDVLAYRFGLKYSPSPDYTLRLGYIFDQSPVPDSTIDPQLPDGNRDIYTVGVDYRVRKGLKLGLAYNFIYGHRRIKDNNILDSLLAADRANGKYRQRIHSLGISLHYIF